MGVPKKVILGEYNLSESHSGHLEIEILTLDLVAAKFKLSLAESLVWFGTHPNHH